MPGVVEHLPGRKHAHRCRSPATPPKEMLVDVAGLSGSISRASRTWTIPIRWSASERADTEAPRSAALSPRHTSWPSLKPFAITGSLMARMARSTWARIRTHYPDLRTHRARGPGGQRRGNDYSADDGVTPTPVISRAILVYNRGRKEHFADGIVVTPSHNPPEDGGLQVQPFEWWSG